jgi:hypothetical protein
MRRSILGVVLVGSLVGGCEKEGGGSSFAGSLPTASSPTVSALVVSVPTVVLTGKSATATASATLSNGESRVVSSGWRSDASAIASVTDAGVITGVSNGTANISAMLDGVTGSQNIRVAPNYGGRWSGQQVVSSCAATGDFRGICEDPEFDVIGRSFRIGLNARHVEDLMTAGAFTMEIEFPPFTAPIETDGTVRFSSTGVADGIRDHASWQMNATTDGRAAGTIREVLSAPGLAVGEVTLDSTLANFVRDASSTLSTTGSSPLRRSLRSRLPPIGRR